MDDASTIFKSDGCIAIQEESRHWIPPLLPFK
jgi:hypothetical protein